MVHAYINEHEMTCSKVLHDYKNVSSPDLSQLQTFVNILQAERGTNLKTAPTDSQLWPKEPQPR